MELLRYLLLGILTVYMAGPGYFLSAQGPVKVEVRTFEDGFQLYRDGTPYYVKGAGGKTHLPELVAAGGNSIRTWSADQALDILDEAHALGLTVCMGLWIQHERHGFDYNNKAAVKAQLEKFKLTVDRIKDHPALLMWGVGNEVDLFYKNTAVWYAVEDIGRMIKEKDPYHPTMVVTAGIDREEVRLIKERCPSIDIYGVNTYADIGGLSRAIREFGWEKAYMVTEWGPTGHWESPQTAWAVAVEQSSYEKAEVYESRYRDNIAADPSHCLGAYVFLWGNKQETTSTWYGLFLPTGEGTEAIDRLYKVWSGKWPENRAPNVRHLRIDGMKNGADIYLKPGAEVEAVVEATDPEGKSLQVKWVFMPESTDKRSGGDKEAVPEELQGLIQSQEGTTIRFTAPPKTGAYRLFAHVFDDSGRAGTVNAPFYVKP